jgi:TatA/E family protein of Tat protein translocase
MPNVLLVFEFLGTTELMVIAFVALIIFGPRKLPEIGRKVGQSLAEFKRASEDFKRTWEYEVETERTTAAPRIEPETVVARESLGAGGDDVLDGEVLSSEVVGGEVVDNEFVDNEFVGDTGDAGTDDAARAAHAAEQFPEGQTIAREPSGHAAAAGRAAEPDDDAPNVFESPEPTHGRQ